MRFLLPDVAAGRVAAGGWVELSDTGRVPVLRPGGSKLRHRVLKLRRSAIAVVALSWILVSCAGSAESDESQPTIESDPTADEVTTTATTTTESTTSSTTTSTTASPSSTIPTPDDGEAFDEYIANRVEIFFELRDQALFNPSADPLADFPELADYSEDPQLRTVLDLAKDLHEKGWAYREPTEPSVGISTDDEHRTSGVQTRDGDVITVFNCEVDDDDIVNAVTDEIEVAGTLTLTQVLTLTKVDGDWKVTTSKIVQKVEGVAGCYLASPSEFPY